MGVCFILDAEGLYAAAADVELMLDLDLRNRNDLEFGAGVNDGAYFEYQVGPESCVGINQVLLRRLDEVPNGWPCNGKAVELSIELLGTDLLELGRISACLERSGNIAPIDYYIVVQAEAGDRPVFWRPHQLHFPTKNSAASAWPTLQCQLVLGFTTNEIATARTLTESLFGCVLSDYQLHDLTGPFLHCARTDSRGVESMSLLVRPNTVFPNTLLYGDRPEHTLLLDVNLCTRDLLELGRIAAHVESGAGNAMQVIAYTAVGDLLRDGVPRSFVRRFANPVDAASTWRLGHTRTSDQDDWLDDEPQGPDS
jgi:hypothetical protein